MRRRSDALSGVVQQLLVVVGRGGRGQTAALGRAVVAGGVEAPVGAVGQKTLAGDLGASQTNWEIERLGGFHIQETVLFVCFCFFFATFTAQLL